MDSEAVLTTDSPKKRANIFSKIFFTWLIGVIKRGKDHELGSLCDLYHVDDCDKSSILGDELETLWKDEMEKAKRGHRKPKLIRALLRMFWRKYFLYGIYMFLHMGFLRVFQPIIIALLIELFNKEKINDHLHLILYSSSLVSLSFLIAFINNHTSLQLIRIGMQVRVACGSLIYRKTLRLNNATLNSHVSGQIGNLLSNDMTKFDNVAAVLHVIWIVPLKIILISYFMWVEIGISFLAGLLGMIFMTVILQGCSGKLSSYFRKKTIARTERRLNILNEFLLGIQTIKMSAWEEPFRKSLKNSRERELKFLSFTSNITALYESFCLIVEKAASYFTLICYYFLGYAVTADKVFFLSQCHNVLQMSMAVFFPFAVQNGAECKVSLRKLEEVLTLEEDVKISSEGGKDVILKGVSTDSNGFVLKDINLEIKQGELCALIGPVGSGKTTLLNLLLKELIPTKGDLKISDNVSYSSQRPWLFNSSIRKNIIFNQQFDKIRYHQVLKVSSLDSDVEFQGNGERSLVGERGMFLSGGQKSRINLARAIYKESDIYLLDDPFSALDAEVAKTVFEKCVCKFLNGKTRIVVTHNLEILKKFDRVIVMDSGRIETQGSYSDIMKSQNEYVNSSLRSPQKKISIQEIDVGFGYEERKSSIISRKSSVSNWSVTSEDDYESCEKTTKETALIKQGFLPYKEYLKASGGTISLLLLAILMLSGQVSISCYDYILTMWSNSNFSTFSGDWYFLYIFTGALLICTFILTVRSFMFFKLCITASRNLHNTTVDSLSNTSIKFFDETPSGRILNRFSKDMATIDGILPRCAIETIQIFLLTIGILVMICVCNYYMLVAVIMISVLFAKLPAWYLSTSKKIKHLEGIAKSPVLSHLGTTLDGILTIRAFKSEDTFKSQFDSYQDIHTSAAYLSWTCTVGFNLWLDLLAVIFLSLIVFGFVILSQVAYVSGNFVGLAVTQAMVLTRILQHGIRQMTECVNQVTSVERIIEYKNLPKEDNDEETKRRIEDWPEKGKLEFMNLYLKYSEYDTDVLKKLNFVIGEGEKVGIVGRSGAGKSSIISAIFRMAILEGSIKIDEVDTVDVPLSVLRDKISIIPQEPALFSTTIRYNLDPHGRHSDSEIWSALTEVDLKSFIPTLDYKIENAGFNLSIGQRQQICLARAILRGNKILILDEATANMDGRTDMLIQRTIRKHFHDCTVITVAHRLETIIDSDKVMLLSFGKLMEMDHPYLLLQNERGLFYKLASECGPGVLKELVEKSSKTFNK